MIREETGTKERGISEFVQGKKTNLPNCINGLSASCCKAVPKDTETP